MKTYIRVMGVDFVLDPLYSILKERIKPYIIDKPLSEPLSLMIPDDKLPLFQARIGKVTLGETEYLATGALFNRKLLGYGALMVHSSAVVVDGYCYSFTGDSGMGKSTHTGIYLKVFPNSFILNDDKPIYRLDEKTNIVTAYGNPWSGKDDVSRNVSAPVKGLCFIEHGTTNEVRRLDKKEAVNRLINQVYRPENKNKLSTTLELMGKLIDHLPIYAIKCDISTQAVKNSYQVMKG